MNDTAPLVLEEQGNPRLPCLPSFPHHQITPRHCVAREQPAVSA